MIDSINLEHDRRPETASHFSPSCSGVAAEHDAILAGVAELVDALDLGSSDESCGGSSPSARTKRRQRLRMTITGGSVVRKGLFPLKDQVRRPTGAGLKAVRHQIVDGRRFAGRKREED